MRCWPRSTRSVPGLAETSKQLETVESQRDGLQAEISALGEQYEVKLAELTARSESLEGRNALLLEKNTVLASRNAELDAQVAALDEQRGGLELQLTALLDQKAALEQRVATLTEETATLQQEAGEMQARLAQAATRVEPAARSSEPVRRAKTAPTVADGKQAYLEGDFERAREIWQRLADIGDPRAQFHLGSLLFEGRLGEPDLVDAYVLLSKSISGGFGPAVAMRGRVRQAMSSQELSEATRLSS